MYLIRTIITNVQVKLQNTHVEERNCFVLLIPRINKCEEKFSQDKKHLNIFSYRLRQKEKHVYLRGEKNNMINIQTVDVAFLSTLTITFVGGSP